MKAVQVCLVCGQDGAKPTSLPSSVKVLLCKSCSNDRFRIAEAEKRAALEVKL